MMGVDEESVLTLRKSMKRFEPTALRMMRLVDSHSQSGSSRIQAGWVPMPRPSRQWRCLFLPVTFSPKTLYVVLPAVIGVAIWRLYPTRMLRNKIRALAAS